MSTARGQTWEENGSKVKSVQRIAGANQRFQTMLSKEDRNTVTQLRNTAYNLEFSKHKTEKCNMNNSSIINRSKRTRETRNLIQEQMDCYFFIYKDFKKINKRSCLARERT